MQTYSLYPKAARKTIYTQNDFVDSEIFTKQGSKVTNLSFLVPDATSSSLTPYYSLAYAGYMLCEAIMICRVGTQEP